MKWPLLRRRTLRLLVAEAHQQERDELRDILKNADKVYLEPVTMGPGAKVTNCLFLGCEPYGIYVEAEDKKACLCTMRYLGLSNPPTPVMNTHPDCPIHKDVGPVWYGIPGSEGP